MAPHSLLVIDNTLCVRYANAQSVLAFGYRQEDLIGMSVGILIPQHLPDAEAQFGGTVPTPDRTTYVSSQPGLHARRRDGSAFPCEVGFIPVTFSDELLVGISIRDTTRRIARLPNRPEFQEAVAVRLTEYPNEPFAIFEVEMRRIQDVNVTFGFDAGDEVTRQFGERLSTLTGPSSYVARVESNTFAAMIPVQAPLGGNFRGLATTIVAAFEEPLIVRGEPITIGATIGVSFYPGHAQDAEFLLRCASVARGVAEDDPTRIGVWEPRRDEMAVNHLTTLTNLRAALDNGVMALHYQPIIDLNSRQVIGAEALIRWSGMDISPGEFIPLAERTGLIRRIDEWVLNSAVRQSATWSADGFKFPLSINVSSVTFQDVRFPERVSEILSLWGVKADRLVIEVTETSAMANPARAIAICHELHEMGVDVAIDDFGTGYSSLAYLHRMEVSSLKIDRSFINGLTRQSEGLGLLQSMLDIGHRLKLMTIVEGIETEEAERSVMAVGGTIGQGYHYARPASVPDFTEWLRSGPYRIGQAE